MGEHSQFLRMLCKKKLLTFKQYVAVQKRDAAQSGCAMGDWDELYPASEFKTEWIDYTEGEFRLGYQFGNALEVARYLKTFGKYWKEARRRLQHEFYHAVSTEIWVAITRMEEKGHFA